MALDAGTKLGPYEIVASPGAGGMGEVSLAHDTRLDRQVAIKALPAHLAQDPDRLARFQREAKVLASLNHPGIGAIYGLEEAGGYQYPILEFIEGETFADRLAKGTIPVDEALNRARQIAEALEYAHEQGIVYRDRKPGNVMVRCDGMVIRPPYQSATLRRSTVGAISTASWRSFILLFDRTTNVLGGIEFEPLFGDGAAGDRLGGVHKWDEALREHHRAD